MAQVRHRQDMRRLGCGGRGTASSVNGGVFGSAPTAYARERLDGKAGGRGNSSSVAGGIFSSDEFDKPRDMGGHKRTTMQTNPWEGAAGAKVGNNNAQLLNGHFRGGLNGVGAHGMDGALGGASNHNAQLLNGHYRGGTAKPTGMRGSGFDLDMLSAAEAKDEEDAKYLNEVKRAAAEDHESIMAAVQQISDESGGLSVNEKNELYYKLQARLRQQAQEVDSPPQMATGGHGFSQMEAAASPPKNDFLDFGQSDNNAHVTGERRSTKVHAPPGGRSSIMLG